MSKTARPSEHLLARAEQATPSLDHVQADTLKRAARFWFGKESYKMRKDDCIRALQGLAQARALVESKLRTLPDQQQQILAIFRRYGGSLGGQLFSSELHARGLVEKPRAADRFSYGQQRQSDPVGQLIEAMLLVSSHGDIARSYHYGYSYLGSHRGYPDLALLPAVRALIQPAGPLPWQPSAPADTPTETFGRPAAEVTLDLWGLTQALDQYGSWKTNRGGTPAKSVQNRLHKLFAGPEDPLLPPDPEGLYYEILRGLGALRVERDSAQVVSGLVAQHLRQPAVVQAWHWVRAWLHSRLWQDGLGVVLDRESHDSPGRVEPDQLHQARELLVWALSRVAHTGETWLDLEMFLADLWSINDDQTVNFYWGSYTWQPRFARARDKQNREVGPARFLAYWLDGTGTWMANAVLATLVYLGLVERGGARGHFLFRLTPLGRGVFGAPEITVAATPADPRFLTVQPNHEVVAYLAEADPRAVWPLAQMSARASSAAGPVQTFTLTRDSIYHALESGLTLPEIRAFLTEHSRTGLPANVEQSLQEWGRRREALILRTDVSLGVYPPGKGGPLEDTPGARVVGERALILPEKGVRRHKDLTSVDHEAAPSVCWNLAEDGQVTVTKDADAITLARLRQFAEAQDGAWRISAASVRQARDRGIPAEQLLEWLGVHLRNELPPLVETAIRNWSSPAPVFLGAVLLLQVPQPQAAAAVLASEQFRPLLLGHIPPDWFLVHAEQRAALEQLLTHLGFAPGAAYQLGDRQSRSGTRRSRKGKQA